MFIKNKTKIIAIFLSLTAMQFAQHKSMSFQVFGGASLSSGDFGSKINHPIEITSRHGFDFGPSTGLASTGFAAGAELSIPVLFNGFAWQLSTKLIINPTDKESIEEEFGKDPKINGSLVFETGTWINIPIFAGLSYGINLIDDVNLLCHLQAGINLTQQAFRKATYSETLVEEVNYKMMTDFGLEAGFSIEFQETYQLSFRYLDLGSPRYEGTRYLNEKLFPDIPVRDFVIEAEEKPVSLFLLTLGYKF